jgi:type IV secretion system protein VirB4
VEAWLGSLPGDWKKNVRRPLMVCTTDGNTPFRFNRHVGDLGHTMILGPTGAGKSTFLALICAQFRRYQHGQFFVFDKGMSMFPLCMAVSGTHYDIGGMTRPWRSPR